MRGTARSPGTRLTPRRKRRFAPLDGFVSWLAPDASATVGRASPEAVTDDPPLLVQIGIRNTDGHGGGGQARCEPPLDSADRALAGDQERGPREELRGPYPDPEQEFEACPVSRRVNDPGHEAADLVEPVGEASGSYE